MVRPWGYRSRGKPALRVGGLRKRKWPVDRSRRAFLVGFYERGGGMVRRVVVAALLLVGVQRAYGVAAMEETLKGCRLPHGKVVIPVPAEARAGGACLFHFADGKLVA